MDFKEAQHISCSEKKGRKLRTVDCNTDIVFSLTSLHFSRFQNYNTNKKVYIFF